MDGMVGQHRNEQVRTDTGVRAMPDWAQAELRLQLPEGVFKVSQSPVRAENLFCIPIGVAGSELDFVQNLLTSTSRKSRLWRFRPELPRGVR